MKVVYTQTTTADIDWLERYYSRTFPEGRANMRRQFYLTETFLQENPNIGRQLEDNEGIREIQIIKTPFSMIYRVRETSVEILRIWDQRQDRSALKF